MSSKNRAEAAKFLDEIIVPCMKKERESKSLSSDQKALVNFDGFKDQMTDEVFEILSKNDILATTVPKKMAKYYQHLDLTVNRYAKKLLVKHFNEPLNFTDARIFLQKICILLSKIDLYSKQWYKGCVRFVVLFSVFVR